MERENRLSDRIADSILSMITVEKRFRPGEQLPNENILSEELNISRTTLREAFRVLAAGEVLEIRRGVGAFVKENFKEQTLDNLSPLAEKINVSDLYEMRLIFEPEAAYYATLRATESELERILLFGERIEKKIRMNQDRTSEERAFHKTIARATHNEFMNKLMPIIYEAIDKGIVLSETNTEALEDTISDHKLIMQFMNKRNAEGARDAMKIHILHAMEQFKIEKQ